MAFIKPALPFSARLQKCAVHTCALAVTLSLFAAAAQATPTRTGKHYRDRHVAHGVFAPKPKPAPLVVPAPPASKLQPNTPPALPVTPAPPGPTADELNTLATAMATGNNPNIPVDLYEAFRLFKLASNKGHAQATFNLAAFYESGTATPVNLAKAAELYYQAAYQGLTQAEYKMGTLFYTGKGVRRSDRDAAIWFRRAALKGDVNALGGLAEVNKALGVPLPLWPLKTDEEAPIKVQQARHIATLENSANTPAPEGPEGKLREHARGVFQSLIARLSEQALPQVRAQEGRLTNQLMLMQTAAEQGNLQAGRTLAMAYMLGIGVPQSLEEGVKWFGILAKHASPDAQAIFGQAHLAGYGVPQNLSQGYYWLRQAALNGSAQAYSAMATFHSSLESVGIRPNLVEAYAWTLLARRSGTEDTQVTQLIEPQLNAQQKQLAQQRASELI